MTETARGPTLFAAVQTSPDLTTWTTQTALALQEYREGQGDIIGSATFRLDWGDITVNDGSLTTVSDLTGISGQFVRILKEDASGSVTIGSIDYTPVWWGRIFAPGTSTNVGSGTTIYTASGIAGIFHERTCWMGRALVKTSPLTFSLAFQLAPFNAWPAGDRSAATGTVGGASVYLHDATQVFTGNKWTARQIVDYLMACNFRYEHPPTPSGSGQAGVSWAISDPLGCLGYTPEKFDARGRTLTEVLNDLAGYKRGMTWFCTVSGTTVTVNITSTAATAITVGTYTLPANTAIWDQLDDTDPFLYPVTITENFDEVSDEIVIQGAYRKVGISLGIWGYGSPFTADSAAQLEPGWTIAEELWCDAYLDTGSDNPRQTKYENAYRRFIIRAQGWDGRQFDSSYGMPDYLTITTSASYGTHGYTGETGRTGLSTMPGLWYSAGGTLPCGPEFSAANATQRMSAVVVAEDYVAGQWMDHTEDWTVWVEDSPPSVTINDGADGAIIRGILKAGRKIAVSVALVDFMPLQVSWRRDPADWPMPTPRTRTIRADRASHEYILQDMVTGTSAEGYSTLAKSAATMTTKDDTDNLRRMLAHARSWYAEPTITATFTDRGVWDSDPSYRPGTILGTITDGVSTRSVDAMVTTRTVRLESAPAASGGDVRFWSTTWQTDRVYPDLEAAL